MINTIYYLLQKYDINNQLLIITIDDVFFNLKLKSKFYVKLLIDFDVN